MRLLLAEDEKDLADVLEEIFKQNKYSIDVVYDGQEAIDYIESDIEYDGIILDIMMPKVDGITVLKTLRQKKINTPVMLLTAKSEVDDKVLGLDSGADDYLAKPFSTKELLARIRAMTRRKSEVIEDNYKLGNITLSPFDYTLSCSNKKNRKKDENPQYILTNKEYQLLEILFQNQGHPISSEILMEKIWGFNSDSEINVVWTHISSLRKKMKDLNSNVIIKSYRNLGYSLEVLSDD